MLDASNTKTTRWGKVEGWWLHHPNTDADHICVLAALSTYADDHRICYPSQATLARHVKRSRPWVNRVIAELTAMGLIRKTARTKTNNAGTTSCEYRLVDRPEELEIGAAPVTDMTSPSHDHDAPCQEGDMTQPITKQNNTRPVRPGPTDYHGLEKMVRPARPPHVAVPADWTPSHDAMTRATTLCPNTDLQVHVVKFVTRCRSKGYLYQADGRDDAWLSWLAEDRLKDEARAKGSSAREDTRARSTPSDPGDRRFAAWATAASAPRLEVAAGTRLSADNPWN